jgi:DNA-binding transcriptional LysR family regulator
MDVRWLEDYLALVELRNFTRAAEFRNVSQAAFSRRIQSLEQWLGTALVVKGATPVRLTEAGEQFREDARVAVERLYESRASIRASQFEVMSQIRIAMPNVLARSEFRQILGLIGDRVDSSFSVIAGTTNDVVARYLAGDADILFSHDCPAIPTHDSLGMHDRLVVRRDRFAPYATRNRNRRAAFGFPGTPRQPFPMVSYSHRAYFARLFEHVVDREGKALPYRLAVQCDMSDVLKEMIVAGHGIGWLPESAVDSAARELISPIGGREWQMDLDICAFRPRRQLGPSIEAIWQALVAGAESEG